MGRSRAYQKETTPQSLVTHGRLNRNVDLAFKTLTGIPLTIKTQEEGGENFHLPSSNMIMYLGRT
jgi:hypothetical protein